MSGCIGSVTFITLMRKAITVAFRINGLSAPQFVGAAGQGYKLTYHAAC